MLALSFHRTEHIYGGRRISLQALFSLDSKESWSLIYNTAHACVEGQIHSCGGWFLLQSSLLRSSGRCQRQVLWWLFQSKLLLHFHWYVVILGKLNAKVVLSFSFIRKVKLFLSIFINFGQGGNEVINSGVLFCKQNTVINIYKHAHILRKKHIRVDLRWFITTFTQSLL